MKQKQKITEFFFNEQDSTAEVYTHNTDLKKRLLAYAQTYPHLLFPCTMLHPFPMITKN